MPHYQHTDGTFWTIDQAGTQLVIETGGKQSIRKFVTPAHAETQLAKLTAEKLAAGFVLTLVKPVAPASKAKPDDDDARLAREIENDPYDASAYTVLGDALQRGGDPRGELIALMTAAEAKPSKKTRSAVVRFLEDNAHELAGSLADQLDLSAYDEEPFVWRHGFLHRVRLDHPALLPQLLSQPCGRFIAELDLRACTTETIELLANRAPKTLRMLELHSQRDLGDLGPLWRALPRVSRVRVHARNFEFAAVDLPSADRVELVAREMSATCVRAVAAAAWPKLERLTLRFGGFHLDEGISDKAPTFDDLAPLLRRTDLERLTHLRLIRGFAAESARELGSAAFAPHLVALDLSGGNLEDKSALELAKHAGRFTALRELVVAESDLTSIGITRLRVFAAKVIERVNQPLLGDHLDRSDPDEAAALDDGNEDDHFDSVEE